MNIGSSTSHKAQGLACAHTNVHAQGVQCSELHTSAEQMQCMHKQSGGPCTTQINNARCAKVAATWKSLQVAAVCHKGFAMVICYLQSIFGQQCCAAKATNARTDHHNISMLGGLLCLAWLLQGWASSCLSVACCQHSGSFWVRSP